MIQNHQTRVCSAPRLLITLLATALVVCTLTLVGSGLASAAPPQSDVPTCATGVDFLGFSDALNKRTYEGTSVGGLSALAYDQRRGVYYSLVDNGPAATSGLGSTRCDCLRKAGRSASRRYWT